MLFYLSSSILMSSRAIPFLWSERIRCSRDMETTSRSPPTFIPHESLQTHKPHLYSILIQRSGGPFSAPFRSVAGE